MKTLNSFSSYLCLSLFSSLLGFFFCSVASAETETFGDYTIHYIAVNSTFLDANIASQYGITRGERFAFLNVTVLKNLPDGKTEAVNATVTGAKKNLMQQSSDISFNEIQEGSAIYYIGEFDFTNAEPVSFTLSVQPDGENRAHELTWDARVYINN